MKLTLAQTWPRDSSPSLSQSTALRPRTIATGRDDSRDWGRYVDGFWGLSKSVNGVVSL